MKKQFTSKFLMALAAIGCCAGLSAQTVIKVGAGQGDKQKTIQMAYDSIMPATLTEAYVIELQSDYDPTTEVYPITFKAKTGASATNSITVKPATGVNKVLSNPNASFMFSNLAFESGVTTITLPSVAGISVGMSVWGIGLPTNVTTTSYVTVTNVDVTTNAITLSNATTSLQSATTIFVGTPLTQTIQFNGGKYITIDGVSRTGNTGLTIQNPNFINCKTILLTGGAQYNTVKNCFIKGANQSGEFNNGTCGQIYFGSGENDYNTFDSNDICDIEGLPMPITMVNMCSPSASANNDNTISNNNLYNIGTRYSVNGNAGFFQFPSGNGTTTHHTYVLNNKMYWTKPTFINLTISAIGVGGSHNGEGNRFEGNVIGYGAADGTGTANITANQTTAALAFNGIINAKNATVKNNTVGGINLTAKAFLGISAQTYSATTFVADDYFVGNTVKDVTVTATANGATAVGMSISTQSPFAANVKNNTVDNIALTGGPAFSCVATGIDVAGTPTATSIYTYTGNKVSNILAGDEFSTSANIAYGVKINQGVATFSKNMIYNIRAINNTTTAIIRGLQTAGSANNQLISNNIVRIGNFVLGDASITALYQGAATSVDHAVKIYNNTLYIGGAAPATATKSTVGFFHTGLAAKTDLKNNIIANKRAVGGAEAHYVAQVVSLTEIASADYNIYQFGKYFGKVDADNATDLDVWAQSLSTPTSIFDAHSKVAEPVFVAPDADVPNMNISQASPAKGTGVVLAEVTTDFNGFARTTSDIGALAFGSFYNSVVSVNDSKLSAYGANNVIMVNNQMGQIANIYSLDGQLVKTSLLKSDNESISINKGFYVIKVNGAVSKVLVK